MKDNSRTLGKRLLKSLKTGQVQVGCVPYYQTINAKALLFLDKEAIATLNSASHENWHSMDEQPFCDINICEECILKLVIFKSETGDTELVKLFIPSMA